MSRAGKWKLPSGGAFLALAVVAACARDIGGSGRGVTGLGGPLINGSRISGTMVEALSVSAPTPGYVPEPTRRAFTAVVHEGRATFEGVVVAVSQGLPKVASDVEFTDREGRRARLLVRSAGPGQPVEAFQVYRDGQLLVDVAFEWQNLNGAWALSRRTLTAYDHGQAVLHQTREVNGTSLARAGLAVPSLGQAGSALSLLLPERLEAQWYACLGEATMTVLAASAVGAATAIFVATPNPVTYLTLVTTIAAYDKAMDAYVKCVFPLSDG